MASEVNFPRGSINRKQTPGGGKNISSSQRNTQREISAKSRKKKRTLSPALNEEAVNGNLHIRAPDILGYKQIQEGMIILGCIRKIYVVQIEVELPGKCSGLLKINDISKYHTKSLIQQVTNDTLDQGGELARLNTIFHVGQFVPVKVISRSMTENGTQLFLSMDPAVINVNWTHRTLREELLVWAAVESEEVHGYQLNAGINNCRIFLPHSQVQEGTSLVVGQPLWCTVQKCEISSSASTVIVTLEKHKKVLETNSKINLDRVIPGMQLNFTITKIVKHGIQGVFMNGCIGYINEGYLTTPLEQVSKYKEGQTVKVYLLYVEPVTKVSYFSLRGLNSVPRPEFEIGEVLTSKVVSQIGGGLSIQLSNGKKGFVPYKRIIPSLPVKSNLSEAIAKKYKPDSSHQCRILSYYYFEQVYICTFEQSVLKEKIFTVNDVKLGELVQVVVKEVRERELVVQLGNIQAYIQNLHLSDVEYSENIKRQFTVGKTLTARVWDIDGARVTLTHKKSFVKSNLCLIKIDPNVVHQQYPGLVARIDKKGVLVVFYGGLKGWLSKVHLKELYGNDADKMFYIGKVIMTTIKDIEGSYLSLVLTPPEQLQRKAFSVGEYVNGKVTNISKEGLVVDVGSIKAFVPVNHLSSSLSLSSVLLKTYSPGDHLTGLLCISRGGDIPTLSLRESVEYKKQKLHVPSINNLKTGALIRCSYDSSYEGGIVVSVPLRSSNRKVKIPYEELEFNYGSQKLPNFQPQQAIVAQVKTVDVKSKTFEITAKLTELYSCDVECCIDLFEQYLNDIDRIKSYFVEHNLALGQLTLGQNVKCVVEKVTGQGCELHLKNDIKGFAHTKHCSPTIQSGKKLVGVILWINYREQYVEISFTEKVIQKLNRNEGTDGVIPLDSLVHADVLNVYPEHVVAITRGTYGQLVFIPTKLHENDFSYPLYHIFQKIKLVTARRVNEKLICIDKKVIHELQKKKARNNLMAKEKRKRSKNKDVPNKKLRFEKNITEDEVSNEIHINETNGLCGDDSENEFEDPVVMNQDADANDEQEDSSLDNDSEYDNEKDIIDENAEINENNSMDVDSEQDDDPNSDEYSRKEDYNSDSNTPESELDSEERTLKNESDSCESENEELQEYQSEEGEAVVAEDNVVDSESEVENISDSEEGKNDSENDQSLNGNITKSSHRNNTLSVLPGITDFFAGRSKKSVQFEDTSQEAAEEQVKKVKKKLSAAEKRELAQQEEERLRRKEIEIADGTAEPQSEEQFEILVTGKPNSSKLWVKYIAYCASNLEISKARNIAKTALARIDLHETEERYNIWAARLNLENNYGDKDSFNRVFEEAVKCNDELRIYLYVIEMLADSQKIVEMDEKVKRVKNKYKQKSEMWLGIIRTYYKIGQIREARNLVNLALKAITKTKHVDLIVKFAIMEFNFGEKSHAEALFERVLQTVPRRVDVWCTYIDQVVKKDDIDGARRILERAVSQNIPAKKMKTLFKKFKDLEVKYGNKESVDYVIELARKYTGLS